MAEFGERPFILAATLDEVAKGQEFTGIPHMVIARWLNSPLEWGEFESRIQLLFNRPNPFDEFGGQLRPVVESTSVGGPNTDSLIHEIGNVSRWPSFGTEAIVRNFGGEIFKDGFAPRIMTPSETTLQVGAPVEFSSIAIVGQQGEGTYDKVLFSQPVRTGEVETKSWLPPKGQR